MYGMICETSLIIVSESIWYQICLPKSQTKSLIRLHDKLCMEYRWLLIRQLCCQSTPNGQQVCLLVFFICTYISNNHVSIVIARALIVGYSDKGSPTPTLTFMLRCDHNKMIPKHIQNPSRMCHTLYYAHMYTHLWRTFSIQRSLKMHKPQQALNGCTIVADTCVAHAPRNSQHI